jgi:hypothetical protein
MPMPKIEKFPKVDLSIKKIILKTIRSKDDIECIFISFYMAPKVLHFVFLNP